MRGQFPNGRQDGPHEAFLFHLLPELGKRLGNVPDGHRKVFLVVQRVADEVFEVDFSLPEGGFDPFGDARLAMGHLAVVVNLGDLISGADLSQNVLRSVLENEQIGSDRLHFVLQVGYGFQQELRPPDARAVKTERVLPEIPGIENVHRNDDIGLVDGFRQDFVVVHPQVVPEPYQNHFFCHDQAVR